ncbi:hypothetical protein DR64_6049 [Paraburkholderia xenovorans LB400]|uniref:DUF4410 domain-containing protein n=1 Tax=Paraburkholderia xenovorans (strain LB400) TaxID=266265 RepID=Q13L02_PARXL|nr:DUF4410 domain-containing protein [Paraburkholderia xenovorans]ABE35237.1 hypothetical protein Bxe_B0717 [Paraburkholderia xenovorans LB400]AIP38100.1 hypothetical protein DR64_6049 [Paraburkholderia xenovorans LB400]
MLTSVKFLKQNAARFACMALVCASALRSGCASGRIENASATSAPLQVRPDNIYVYTFSASADQVKLDGGMMQKVKTQLEGSSAAQKQAADAAAVREQVADEIVHQLQSMGLRAIRSDIPAPADQNVLLVQGSFDTIDSGNRRRRMLIGLGAGKSEVSGSVRILYKPAGGAPRLVQTFNASADSGKAPGMVETAGVGAAAGSVATSAAAGGGLHAVSETQRAGVSADAKRLADAVARQIGEIGVSGGWLSTQHSHG